MILLTGATGFLGKNVAKKLELRGIPFKRTSLSMGIDLRDWEQMAKLFEDIRPTCVLNCAAYVGGIQFGMLHTAELFKNNLLMSVNLLEACRTFSVKRLVNPIANCAYPGAATLFKEDEFWNGPLHETVDVYGMARKMSYVGATAYNRQYGQDTINIVLSNMYGPGDHFDEERSHALGALIMKMVNAKETGLPSVCVWGTGDPVREWLHVDDGAEAMVRALDIAPYNGIINIGTAEGISIKAMAFMIKRFVGYEGELIFDTSKPDGAPYKTVDGSLGRRLFAWSPETNFETGVKETVEWYMKHRNEG